MKFPGIKTHRQTNRQTDGHCLKDSASSFKPIDLNESEYGVKSTMNNLCYAQNSVVD